MAFLNKFLLNTDYDSFKIAEEINWKINFPATTIEAGKSVTLEYTYTTREGVYFESQSATITLFPDLGLTGSSHFFANKLLNPGDNSTAVSVDINIYKRDKTTYVAILTVSHPSVQGSTASVSVPAFDADIKLNLLVPSEQQ